MSRLKEKLARLNRKTESVTHEVTVHTPLSFAFNDPFIEQLKQHRIGLYENEFGSFLLKRTEYDPSYCHGMYSLNQLTKVESHLHRFFIDGVEQPVKLDKVLFFDLETTGLGTGTGNIPFMVGLAYFQNESYMVEQAVIRHAGEERALLAYLHRLTANFDYIVTYNGKTFDWPLIVNRYVLNGMREEIWQPKHIDLLHPSRSIWRNALQSCKLSYIEEARLGITRIDDLPGSEAPDCYFRYLADGNIEHLLPVYQHNELDMLTLVSLLTRFGYLLSDENVTSIVQLPLEPEEMIRTGLWLEKMGLTKQCEALFELAIQLPVHYAQTLYKLSIRDKQMGNDQRANYLWGKVIESDTINIQVKIDCYIQLAIYEEHKLKRPSEALKFTKQAISLALMMKLDCAQSRRTNLSSNKLMLELEKREQRLLKKCAK